MAEINESAAHAGVIYPIHGTCDVRFTPVLDRLVANFAAGWETGASVAVVVDGRSVVDLWGGYADAACTRLWQHDTIVSMHSVAKGVTAICLYMLVDRGLVDPDAPVARYWPEFAAAGKENLPLRYVLDHRAGLPYLTEPLPRGAIFDWAAMTGAIARQAPVWNPGEKAGYHVFTQGFIEGEIIRRVTGLSVGDFFRREVSAPLGIDYTFGLGPAEIVRCAEGILPADSPLRQALANATTDEGRFWAQLPVDEDFNSVAYRTSEIPSGNGHGNARAVACLYGVLVSDDEPGRRLMSRATLERMIKEQHNLQEQFLKRHYHQGSGVVLNSPPVAYMGPNSRAFGHHGAGGSIGFGDPDARLGFSYAINKMERGAELGLRRDGLVDAAFLALER